MKIVNNKEQGVVDLTSLFYVCCMHVRECVTRGRGDLLASGMQKWLQQRGGRSFCAGV